MATLPKMIDAIQKVDLRPATTLIQFGRVLRDAGLIPGGKRGAGAPHLDTGSVANLFIGLSADSPSKSTFAVILHRRLRRRIETGKLPSCCKVLDDLNQVVSFGEAIEYLIDNASAIAQEIADQHEPHPTADRPRQTLAGLGWADLRICLGSVVSKIQLRSAEGVLWEVQYAVDQREIEVDRLDEYAHVLNSDRRVEVVYSFRTIAAYHFAMADGL